MPITQWALLPNPPCQLSLWEETGVPGETHDFRQSVDFYSSHEDWVRVALRKFSLRLEPAALGVKGKCANHFATANELVEYSRNTSIATTVSSRICVLLLVFITAPLDIF